MSDTFSNPPTVDSNPMPGLDRNGNGKSPGLIVIAIGLVTALLMLFLISVLNKSGFQAMGFYIFVLLPIGAIFVGLVAGSGYAIGSWVTGAKIGDGLLVLVVLLQVCSYVGAQFLEYQQVRQEVVDQQAADIDEIRNNQVQGAAQVADAMKEQLVEQVKELQLESMRGFNFANHFDGQTRSFQFDGGKPLGVWGYGIRLLEILGFAFGGLIGPLMLSAHPYCSECQVYRKVKQVGVIPAGVVPPKLKKKDHEGQNVLKASMQEAQDGGLQLVEESIELAVEENSTEFCILFKEFHKQKKVINKQSSRIKVELQYCPNCSVGTLVYSMQSEQGDQLVVSEVARSDVSTTFVRTVKVSL